MRDMQNLEQHDSVAILASEALANRHVLSGLVHDAKGPLNHFYLRLALLEATLARQLPGDSGSSAWSKHLETLKDEAQQLLQCVEAIGKLAHPDDDVRDEIDLNAALRDIARLLRHAATIREAAFDVSLSSGSAIVRGNAHRFSLALIGLTTCVLDSAEPQARIAIALSRDDNIARITLSAAPAALPAGLADAMFSLHATNARFVAPITARILIEARGGDVRVVSDQESAWGFAVAIPLLASTS